VPTLTRASPFLGVSHASHPTVRNSRAPQFFGFSWGYLCLHPLTQNVHVRQGNTCGSGVFLGILGETFDESGLTWSDSWKNRPVKQSPKVVVTSSQLLCSYPGALSDDAVWRLSRTSGRRAVCAAGQLDDAYLLIGLGSAGLAQGCHCALLLQAWAGGISWRPPAYSLLIFKSTAILCNQCEK